MITQGEALALTLAVELPVGMLCLRFGHPVPRDVVRRVLAIAAASLITHPLAWASNQRLAGTATADGPP